MSAHLPYSPQQFLAELFSSRAAQGGEVIRRKIRDVERFVGRDAFLDEMRRRGYPVVENGGAVCDLLQPGTDPPSDVM